jgi:hypothetical protein
MIGMRRRLIGEKKKPRQPTTVSLMSVDQQTAKLSRLTGGQMTVEHPLVLGLVVILFLSAGSRSSLIVVLAE